MHAASAAADDDDDDDAGAMGRSTSRSTLTAVAQRMTSTWGKSGQTCTGTDVSKDCSAACRAVHAVFTCLLFPVQLCSADVQREGIEWQPLC
jgi:hypothetical protein